MKKASLSCILLLIIGILIFVSYKGVIGKAYAQSTTIIADNNNTHDTYVNGEPSSTGNIYGNQTQLVFGPEPGGRWMTFIKIDLSSIPVSQVDDAKLRLYVYGGTNLNSTITLYAREVTQAWDEATEDAYAGPSFLWTTTPSKTFLDTYRGWINLM
ncbi:DNRLRE domain-containing protein [Bacillus salitolerans]|uniref:DNRLRE domain-containing protein n=1 Tax=Bacillus salitolerans TaxID=1437434 RepID=A0ABW4LP46_9BACI